MFAIGVDAILQRASSLLRSRWNRWKRVKERVDMPIRTICLLCRVSTCLLKLQTAPMCVSLQCVFHSSVCVTNCTSCCVSAALSLHWHTPAHLSPPIQTLSCSLIDVRGCRHSGFRHSGFSPRGLDVRGSDVRGRLFRTLGFRTFGVFENGRSGLNPERLKLNAVSLNPERPKTPNVRK